MNNHILLKNNDHYLNLLHVIQDILNYKYSNYIVNYRIIIYIILYLIEMKIHNTNGDWGLGIGDWGLGIQNWQKYLF